MAKPTKPPRDLRTEIVAAIRRSAERRLQERTIAAQHRLAVALERTAPPERLAPRPAPPPRPAGRPARLTLEEYLADLRARPRLSERQRARMLGVSRATLRRYRERLAREGRLAT